jgi:hypothetical protein
MGEITLSVTEFNDATEEDYEVVERSDWRHGTRDTIVFPYNGKFYRTVVDCHHEEGWQLYNIPVECVEVHKVTVTKEEWRPV